MLDVHILISADTPAEWVAQARESVRVAAEQAGYPVAMHEISGEPGHIGNGRKRGFKAGRFPFCTFVDDDDYVMPNAFAVLAPVLLLKPRLVFTRERLEQNGKPAGVGGGHHLAVVPRWHASRHNWCDYPEGGEGTLYAKLGAPVQLGDEVYVHRVYRSKGRALREQYSR